jgi:ketopantoate reductase
MLWDAKMEHLICDARKIFDEITIIGFKYRKIKFSSLQSIERGRRPEIDFLNGYICDRGRDLNVSTPVNDAVRANYWR